MGYNTKIRLGDSNVIQSVDVGLTLSGNTKIADSGDLRYNSHPTFTGDTQIIDKKYIDDAINTLESNTLTGSSNGLTDNDNIVELGGSLTKDTTINGGGLFDFNINQAGNITINSASNIILETYDSIVGTDLDVSATEINVSSFDYAGDDYNPFFKGIVYNHNYHSAYTLRSLPDVDYVTGITSQIEQDISNIDVGLTGATNGLTSSNGIVKLGGSLNETTTITITSGGSLFIDDQRTNTRGIKYSADYSTYYTERSLVDKGYVDTIASNLRPKTAVIAATTGNITLSGEQTIDGVVLTSGDRVLVKNQTNATENGVYIIDSGAWTRAEDFDGNPDGEVAQGMWIPVLSGSSNNYTSWIVISDNPIDIGTDDIIFAVFSKLLNIAEGQGINITTGINQTISVDLVDVNSGLEFNGDELQLADISGSGTTWQNGQLDANVSSDVITGNVIGIKLDVSNNLAIDSNDITSSVPISGASNGLSLSGKDVVLGGTLTNNTTIAGDGNNIIFSGLTNIVLSASTGVNITGNVILNTVTSGDSTTDSVLVRDALGVVKEINASELGENNNNYHTTTANTNITLTNEMYVVLVDSSGGEINVTLPSEPENGQTFKIKDSKGSAITNIITVSGNGINIDDSSTATINTDYGAIEVTYDSDYNQWFVLSFVN